MPLKEVLKNPGSVSIDTRTIKKGDIFFAIKGKKFDGHDFVKEAFLKGASKAVVQKLPKGSSSYRKHLIKVKDTITALGIIARTHRLKFNIPVVAITGTNGKTTAKDITAHVLSAKYNVLKNESSKNNLIGLPLTLLKLTKKHDIAVVEMGMNRLGEIGMLSRIVIPKIGVITNIGPSHLEFLGTLKNVFAAKSELLKHLPRDGTAILNKDDYYLSGIQKKPYTKICFGIENPCDFQATNLSRFKNIWSFRINGGSDVFQSSLLGKHNIYNALIAISVARKFDIDYETIKKQSCSYKQKCPMRLEHKKLRGLEVLDDSYNSNPLSMECAINTLINYTSDGKKIIVSGDMLELGKNAEKMHEEIGRSIASNPIDTLITVGKLSKFVSKGAKRAGMNRMYHAHSHRDAAEFLCKITKPGDVVLVKGSRGAEMEKIIQYLSEET